MTFSSNPDQTCDPLAKDGVPDAAKSSGLLTVTVRSATRTHTIMFATSSLDNRSAEQKMARVNAQPANPPRAPAPWSAPRGGGINSETYSMRDRWSVPDGW
jgi:hypothetical protein